MENTCDLLLIPGLEGSSIFFEPLLAALPASVSVHTVEYPSTGPMAYADLLPIVRAAVPAGRPFIVLGWSFGGPLAVLLGADPPPGLRGVIIASSFITNPQPWLRWLRPFIGAPLVPVFRILASLKALVGGYSSPQLRGLQQRVYAVVNARAFAARMRTALTADFRAEWMQIRVPVLYLGASHDVVVPAYCLREMQRLRPGLDVAIIAGPHLALVTNAPEAARRVTAFLVSGGQIDQQVLSS